MLISGLIVAVAIAVYVILTIKGSSPIIAAVIATAVVSIFAFGGFFTNYFDVFPNGMSAMFGGFFMQFTFAVAFGGMLTACGAADRMAKTMIGWLGEKNFIYAIIAVTILFGLTGAPPLALMPGLTFSILQRARIPRYIGMVAVSGATPISNIIPGNMSLPNMLPTNFLGTNIYAAPALGIVAAVVGIVCLCVYCNYLIKQAKAGGIGYDPWGNETEIREDDDTPSFAWSIIPPVFVLVFCSVLIVVFHLMSTWAMVLSCSAGIVMLLIANRKYIHKKPLAILKESAESIQRIIVCALAVCGFAAVVGNTEIYQGVIPVIMNWDIHPAVIIVVGAMIVAALCADGISGVAAFSSTIGVKLVESGVSPVLVHRLTTITCTTFDSLPHGGAVTMALNLYGYDVKRGYKYILVANVAIPCIYTVAALILALILY
jgi:H+/gluconate symporter-like permease